MQNFTRSTVQSCYYNLRRISSIRRYLSIEATTKLTASLILSRLDYCNGLLAGLSQKTLYPLQRIQNNAAKLVLLKKKSDHVTPLLHSLHWLPVEKRITYKLCVLCYTCMKKFAPAYLSDSLQLYTPSRSLRSASDSLRFKIPRINLSTVGSRAFSFAAPSAWNALPLSLRQTEPLDAFKNELKTFLFNLS